MVSGLKLRFFQQPNYLQHLLRAVTVPFHGRDDLSLIVSCNNSVGFQARCDDFLSNPFSGHAGSFEVDLVALFVFEVIHDDRNLGAKRSSIKIRVEQGRLRVIGVCESGQGEEENQGMEVFLHRNRSNYHSSMVLASDFWPEFNSATLLENDKNAQTLKPIAGLPVSLVIMKRNAFVCLLALVLTWNFSTTDGWSEADVRTWTDNTGKFTFEGTFVRSRGNEIMLKKVDGQLLRVPLNRLSREDQDYVTELESGPTEATDPLTGIAWYSSVEPAFAEAKRSNRPIMFMAAATQCSGVPGIF